jgi:UDP-glucosyltransferase BX8/BX9
MTPPPAPTMAAPEHRTGAPLGRRRHVLLFPLPFQGHINPMFRLAGLLHARGFAVTVFHTRFNAPDPTQHPAYRFVPVPVGASGSVPVPDDRAEAVSRIIALADACGAAFGERLTAVLKEYSSKGGDVACLIADAHLLPVVRVAKQQGVPALALRTGSAASYTSLAAYPMLCEKGYLPAQGMSSVIFFESLYPGHHAQVRCIFLVSLIVWE